MYGIPIARKMENWWKEHGGQHDSPEWRKWLDLYFTVLKNKHEEMLEEHVNKDEDNARVFGMSKAGGCIRESSLKVLGYEPSEEFSGSARFTFWQGHSIEVAALTTLALVGYESRDYQKELKLYSESEPDRLVMRSAADGDIKMFGNDTIVSVKSTAYKMSSMRKGKFFRRGFTELPLSGTLAANPSHYAQLQIEMEASDYSQGLMVYASKDIVQVFENDDYVGEKGNGSLTFYTELINYDEPVASMISSVHDTVLHDYIDHGKPAPALWFKSSKEYIELPEPGKVLASNKWGGKNQEATGTFNPCGGCKMREACLNS